MATAEPGQCNYLVRVKTGDRFGAGTDSTITLKLMNSSGESFAVDNLKDWGIMEAGHEYFQAGNLDVFQGSGPCLSVCAMKVTSNGQGVMPGWYLEFVEFTIFGSGEPTKVSFPVNQWLALDEPPYQLYAEVNLCR